MLHDNLYPTSAIELIEMEAGVGGPFAKAMMPHLRRLSGPIPTTGRLCVPWKRGIEDSASRFPTGTPLRHTTCIFVEMHPGRTTDAAMTAVTAHDLLVASPSIALPMKSFQCFHLLSISANANLRATEPSNPESEISQEPHQN